jgi:hypothetical protein
MARTLRSALLFTSLATLVAVPLTSQQVLPRDSSQPAQPVRPTVRSIPIGTSVISGTVTTADTGRPVRGAQVFVSGSFAPARAGGPASAAPPGASGVVGGVIGGIPGGTVGGVSGGRTGAPAGASSMLIQVGGSTSRTALTDAFGNFVFERLPAGQYTVRVSRTSFLNANYGEKKPGASGTAFALAEGQKATIKLQMIRGGVITGTVIGEDGEPQSGAQVAAWHYMMTNGVKRLQRTSGAQTDDRGVYRLFGLQPGDYLVSSTPNSSDLMMADRMLGDTTLIEQAIASGAIQPPAAPGMPPTVAIPIAQPMQSPMEGPPPGYLPVYYPSASVPASAAIVHIAGGDERSSIDIQVHLVQASNVQGTILNPPGQDLAVQLSLVSDDPLSETSFGSRADANGRFTFRNVSPGKYTVVAQVIAAPAVTILNGVPQRAGGPPPQLNDSQKWWGRAAVSVEGQPTRWRIHRICRARS